MGKTTILHSCLKTIALRGSRYHTVTICYCSFSRISWQVPNKTKMSIATMIVNKNAEKLPFIKTTLSLYRRIHACSRFSRWKVHDKTCPWWATDNSHHLFQVEHHHVQHTRKFFSKTIILLRLTPKHVLVLSQNSGRNTGKLQPKWELSVAGNIYVLYVVQIVPSLENGNLRDTGAVRNVQNFKCCWRSHHLEKMSIRYLCWR